MRARVRLASNLLLKRTFHLQTLITFQSLLLRLMRFVYISSLTWKGQVLRIILMENGKEENLSQESWPTIKLEFSETSGRLPHTSLKQRHDSSFILLQIVQNTLPLHISIDIKRVVGGSQLLDWFSSNRDFTIGYFQCITAKSAPEAEREGDSQTIDSSTHFRRDIKREIFDSNCFNSPPVSPVSRLLSPCLQSPASCLQSPVPLSPLSPHWHCLPLLIVGVPPKSH